MAMASNEYEHGQDYKKGQFSIPPHFQLFLNNNSSPQSASFANLFSMTNYQLLASNNTAQGWHFGLYQEQPEQQGLKTMAWKVLSLSAPQPNPTTGSIPWTLTYEVTIPQHQVSGDSYVGGLTFAAKLGYKYELYVDAGYNQIKEVGQGTSGYIDFLNNTTSSQNMGLMVSGTLMSMQENVAGGVAAQFKITPNYYCGLFTNLTQGQFVSSNAAVSPVQITIPDGLTKVTLSANVVGGQISLSTPKYS